MYTKANIITICETLAIDLQDDDTLSRFFDDTIERIGLSDFPFFYSTALVEISDGTATYDFESDMLRLVYAIMEDTTISIVEESELSAYSLSWRGTAGTPIALTQDDLERQYTLYPEPDFDSGAFIPVHGEPYGEDYPDDWLVVFYTENKSADFQEYCAFPIAFESVAREFGYASSHQDIEFAESCAAVAQFFTFLLGDEKNDPTD